LDSLELGITYKFIDLVYTNLPAVISMKFTWKGKWRKGEVIIEAESIQELDHALKELASRGEIHGIPRVNTQNAPEMPPVQGCSDAIRALMKTDWGKQLRSMSEIKKVLEANALHFSKGTLSGTLTTMTKRGDIRRMKKDGRWKYLAKETG
jgi:hypothetical protein